MSFINYIYSDFFKVKNGISFSLSVEKKIKCMLIIRNFVHFNITLFLKRIQTCFERLNLDLTQLW